MIRLIREEEAPSLISLCEAHPLGCRTASALLCYQGAPFLDVWVQEDAGISAVLCRLDGAMTIVELGRSDAQELGAFCKAVRMFQPDVLPRLLDALGLPSSSDGAAMVWNVPPQPLSPDLDLVWDASPRRYYPILAQCQGEGISLPPFDQWYVDCSHRMRRGWMRGAIALQEGVDAGCILAAETPCAALITGVAAAPSFRGRGLGKRLVAAMAAALDAQGKRCFLLCRRELIPFYQPLGFAVTDSWALYTPSQKEVFP